MAEGSPGERPLPRLVDRVSVARRRLHRYCLHRRYREHRRCLRRLRPAVASVLCYVLIEKRVRVGGGNHRTQTLCLSLSLTPRRRPARWGRRLGGGDRRAHALVVVAAVRAERRRACRRKGAHVAAGGVAPAGPHRHRVPGAVAAALPQAERCDRLDPDRMTAAPLCSRHSRQVALTSRTFYIS